MSSFNSSKIGEPTQDQLVSPWVSYANEVQAVKNKLACQQHGENSWCWVNPFDGEHIPICLHDVQLWAQYLVRIQISSLIHDLLRLWQVFHPEDYENPALPYTTHFAELLRTRTPRSLLPERIPTPVITESSELQLNSTIRIDHTTSASMASV